MSPHPRPLGSRFWQKVGGETASGCWPWQGARTEFGYGQIFAMRRVRYAHRLSWEMHRGPIPSGQHVLHRCDNPPCVNPEHLFIGTNAENISDKLAKGRQPRGQAIRQSRLDPGKVLAIKATLGLFTQQYLADLYGVSQSSISKIAMGETWVHIG